jgi:hypothetical protein
MDFDIQYKALVENLKVLTLSLNEQKALLPEFVGVQDEVINSFFEAFLLLPQLIENGYLSLKSVAAILRLYNKIETSSPDIRDEDLEKIRDLARISLIELGEPTSKPDLSLFTWIGK